MNFSETLRERRLALGKTVSQCAAALGKTQPAWTLYESGKRLPKLDELLDICQLLETTPNELLGIDRPQSTYSVTGSGNVIAQGAGAKVQIGAAGELPQCSKCPHRKKLEKLERLLAK